MSKKSYRGKYRGKSEIGYKGGRRGLLGFWINLNLIINIVIIAGMISAVFSFESMLGEVEGGAYSWARWVLYAAIAIYIVLFIHLVVSIRKDLDDSRAQMKLFNYRSISVIARKLLTILYTVFMCFILVDSWIAGVVGSESLIFVIGIIIIAFYAMMIAVDILKIVIRRKNYEYTKKKRSLKKGRLQSMRKDLECQQVLVEQKIIETRALKGSMVFRLLSINKTRYAQMDNVPDYLPDGDELAEPASAVAVAADAETTEIPAKPQEIVAETEAVAEVEEKEPELISMTMEELQQTVVVADEEQQEEEEPEEPEEIIDEAQVTFDELDPQFGYEDDAAFVASSALAKDFSAIFNFASRTGL